MDANIRNNEYVQLYNVFDTSNQVHLNTVMPLKVIMQLIGCIICIKMTGCIARDYTCKV